RQLALQSLDLRIELVSLGLDALDRVLDQAGELDLGAGVLLDRGLEHLDRLGGVGVAAAGVGGALEPRLQRRGAPRLLFLRDHLVEVDLAHEGALLELLEVEPEQLVADREAVPAVAELGGDLLAAPVPDLDRAAPEIPAHRVGLAAALELELES